MHSLHQGQGYPPRHGWQSEGSTHESYSEKKEPHPKDPNKSKRFIWRMFRLGATLALTITVLVLTLIILVAGRHGDGSSDLSLITIDMTNFARFDPPVITLVDNTTEATKTRRGLGSIVSDVAGKASDAANSVETFASGAASAVESAAGAVATAAEAEADKIIDEIGDKLDDIENAVTGLMDKVLGTIQDALNEWLEEAAGALDDLDIPRTMSLHLTTYCSSNASSAATATNSTATAGSSSSNSSTAATASSQSCTRLFSRGETSFNATANNGTIFGFQPGAVLARALGVFYVPEDAQLAIREPVDGAVDTVDRLVHEAGADLSAWAVNLLFVPIVVMYALAAFFTCLLLLVLLAATALSFRSHEGLHPKVFGLCGAIAACAAFFLLLGSVILTVIALVAYVVGLGAGVVDITVSSSSKLKWMSWAAFIIMAVVAISLKVEEFVAECVFWWNFLAQLCGKRKTKGAAKEMFRDPSRQHN
ncbi:hypothetical protein UCDDA912_g04416 [Diaporthe ampelina]|uniref:Sur7 protein n=1 Tax=Diaporthe ampelina TaxID=1214573 RepID=A0A0G2I715_9PEZI|nr:hypothetical protein UCDDA912_g04416 [Diaporthe ampelina]